MPVSSPCAIDTDSFTINTVDCDDRSCLSIDMRFATAPTDGEASCNALYCVDKSRGNVGGVAVLARDGDCVTLRCVTDRNGFSALQPDLILYVPPPADTNIPEDDVQCLPGENLLTCVTSSYAASGAVQRSGGLSGLVRFTDSIDIHVTQEVRCGVPYRVTTADLTVVSCEKNALTVTPAGVSVSVGTTSCIDLRIVVDSTTCLDTPAKTIQAFPIIVNDPRNFFTCTPLGFSAMVRDPKDLPVCIHLTAVDDSVAGLATRWIEATPEICASADNIFECGPDGLGAYVTDTCTVNLTVEYGGGCGGKVVRGYIPIAMDTRPAVVDTTGRTPDNVKPKTKSKRKYNLASASGAGLAMFVQPSSCIRPTIVQDASGQDAQGCSGLPRVTQFDWISCASEKNAFDCAASGMGAYVAKSCTVDLVVEATSVGCGGSKAVRGYIIAAPDIEATLNLTGSTTTGISSFMKKSDCIKVVVVQDVGESTSTNRTPEVECFTTPRIIELQPIIADDPANALTCSDLGLAMFVRPSNCIDIRVQTWHVNGIETKAVIADLIINNSGGTNRQALRCGPPTLKGPDGAFVAVATTSCIDLEVRASRESTLDAIHAVVIRSSSNSRKVIDPTKGLATTPTENNAFSTRGTCLGGTSGLAVVFRDLGCTGDSANITFGQLGSPCGGFETVACVDLATNNPAGFRCNGLLARPDGLWSPPDTNGTFGFQGSTGQIIDSAIPADDATTDASAGSSASSSSPTDKGSGAPITLPLAGQNAACNPIGSGRDAIGMVIVRMPAVTFRLHPSVDNALRAQVSGTVKVGVAGATMAEATETYGTLQIPGARTVAGNQVAWGQPWEYTVSGQTAFYAVDRIKPGDCIECTFTPTVDFNGSPHANSTPSAKLHPYSITALCFATL